ncbi:Cell cycle checkpoint protein RAD17 [Halotydeus destructor]|nr:Cell cycle checkpoint protein RAD17 [Halotydeus destructor]
MQDSVALNAPERSSVAATKWLDASVFEMFDDDQEVRRKRKYSDVAVASDFDEETVSHSLANAVTISPKTKLINSIGSQEPRNKEDLALSWSKIREIEEWLEQSTTEFSPFIDSRKPFAMLSGPSGSAKSTALRVIAKEKQIALIEFNCQFNSDQEKSNHDFEPEISQLQQFKNFIFEANRHSVSLLSKNSTKKVLLVEEFPYGFIMNSKPYHQVLAQSLKTFKRLSPIVFVVSSNSTDKISLDYKLFPKTVQAELDMKVIKFNPVSDTELRKALRRESILNQSELEEILSSSNGDVRCAFNLLEYKYRHKGDMTKQEAIPKLTKKRKCTVGTSAKNADNLGRDSSLNFFHFLGKICYAKRILSKTRTPSTSVADDVDVDLCSSDKWNLARADWRHQYELFESAEDLISGMGVSSGHLTIHLHQNYAKFANTMAEALNCISYLSDADYLGSDQLVDVDKKSIWQEYESQLAVRGTMFSLPPTLVGINGKEEKEVGGRESEQTTKKAYSSRGGIVLGKGTRSDQSADQLKTTLTPESERRKMKKESPFSSSHGRGFISFDKVQFYDVRRRTNDFALDTRHRIEQLLPQRPSSQELVVDMLPFCSFMSSPSLSSSSAPPSDLKELSRGWTVLAKNVKSKPQQLSIQNDGDQLRGKSNQVCIEEADGQVSAILSESNFDSRTLYYTSIDNGENLMSDDLDFSLHQIEEID